METPKLFISYSHDSQTHKEWVLSLATRLRQSGVDAVLDLWELQPGDDLPLFMERNLASAERILMICTDKYVDKANAGTGGVGYEKMIITADLMRDIDSNKVIPIIRQSGTSRVPNFLKTKMFLDFSRQEQFEFNFDELVRSIHKAPLFVKPSIGDKPTFQAPSPAKKTADPKLLVMKIAIQQYESNTGSNYLPYSALAKRAQNLGMSRLFFDAVASELVVQGLLRIEAGDYYYLTDSGRKYAFENQLA